MTLSWIIWDLALLLVVVLVFLTRSMPNAKTFQSIAINGMVIGLVASIWIPLLRWHLLWYTPVILLLSMFIAHRRLFALSRQIKKIGNTDNLDQQKVQDVLHELVDEYNKAVTEDQHLK